MKNYILLFAIVALFSSLNAQEIKLEIDKVNTTELKVGEPIILNITCSSAIQDIVAFQMYFDFDQKVLTYQKTSNTAEIIASSWMENINDFFYSSNWILINKPINIEAGTVLCSLQFIYHGGETDITWQHKQLMENGYIVKGKSLFYDSKYQEILIEYVNGCVCKQ